MTPPPPDPFPDFNVTTLKAGTKLFRIHDPALAGSAANPGIGGLSRFAPLARLSGGCLPTLYAASTFEAAVHESIFHDVPYDRGPKFVRFDKVASRALSIIKLGRDVELARLHAPDLSRLGLSRAQLVDTLPMAYKKTARWAQAFHRAKASVGGLVWTSRRCDPAKAYVFFEDRVGATSWSVIARHELNNAPAQLEEIRMFAQRAGITLII